MSLVEWPAQGASGKERALGTAYLYLKSSLSLEGDRRALLSQKH